MLQWIALAALVLSCPIRKLRPHIFNSYIREMEEVKNSASLAYSMVKLATDEKSFHRFGKVWHKIIFWKASLP